MPDPDDDEEGEGRPNDVARDDAIEASASCWDEFGEPVLRSPAPDPAQATYSHKQDDALGHAEAMPRPLEALEDEVPVGWRRNRPSCFAARPFVVGVITTDGDGVVALRPGRPEPWPISELHPQAVKRSLLGLAHHRRCHLPLPRPGCRTPGCRADHRDQC